MTLRIHTTPLRPTVDLPAARSGGFDPSLRDAILRAPGTESLLAKLDAPDVLVVTTGQQPGLFTGPLYTIHKALSAKALAGLLEARWERPVVPLFWLANDDHDFAEASGATWLRADGTVAEGRLAPRPADAPQLPMYRTPLGAEIASLVAGLASDLRPLQWGKDAAMWIEHHWRPGRTVGEAYAGSLAELLGRAGVLTFDPTHRSAKRAMAPHLIKALGLARELDRDLHTRAGELAAIGQDGGVPVGDGATLVMLEGKEGRDRLVADGDGFLTRRSGERFTLAELQALAAAEPERLSPNVLLRPVLEATILPTVAYLAGPGELRYWQLTPPIYSRMRTTPQAALPRWSGIIIEPRVARALEAFDATLGDLTSATADLERRIAEHGMAPGMKQALARLSAAVEEQYAILEREGGAVAPQLVRSLQTLHRKMEWLAERTEGKVVAHLRRRDTEGMARIARARDSVRPLGHPQERTLTIAPFLARYGPGILDEIAATARAWYAAALEGRGSTP
jgi:bacillithiol biosynthesis cysteine-adding enzyme BshC